MGHVSGGSADWVGWDLAVGFRPTSMGEDPEPFRPAPPAVGQIKDENPSTTKKTVSKTVHLDTLFFIWFYIKMLRGDCVDADSLRKVCAKPCLKALYPP